MQARLRVTPRNLNILLCGSPAEQDVIQKVYALLPDEVKKITSIRETQKDYLIDNIVNDDGDFTVLLFHTLRSMLIQEGINIDPVLQATGVRIGNALFDSVYDDELEIFLQNIADFWQAKGLGELSFEIGNVIKVTSYGCFECQLLPKTGKPACFLDTGIFEGLFTEFFNLPVSVIETQCYTMGDEKCVFEIEPKHIKNY